MKRNTAMTPPFRNPVLWLRRFRKRCGYGVHSPFAFGFITEVVYEDLPYYAFDGLDAGLGFWQRFRVKRYLHLLFRLTNFEHPERIVFFDVPEMERRYVCAACPGAVVEDWGEGNSAEEKSLGKIDGKVQKNTDGSAQKTLFVLGRPNDEVLQHLQSDSMLVLSNVHLYKEWWDGLPKVLGFDLYDVGVTFFNKKYNKQDYVVNF